MAKEGCAPQVFAARMVQHKTLGNCGLLVMDFALPFDYIWIARNCAMSRITLTAFKTEFMVRLQNASKKNGIMHTDIQNDRHFAITHGGHMVLIDWGDTAEYDEKQTPRYYKRHMCEREALCKLNERDAEQNIQRGDSATVIDLLCLIDQAIFEVSPTEN